MAVNFGRGEVIVDADGKHLNAQMRRIAGKAGADAGKEFDKGFGGAGFKNIFKSAEKSFANMRRSADQSFHPVRRLSEAWRSLGHNTRQWTLIIGAVLTGMQTLATLSSASGAGLIVLGGALTGVVVGLGGAVAAFSGLTGEISKLPAEVRPAAKAFQDLKNPLRELRDSMTARAFTGAEGTFRSIGNTIRRLTPAFNPLADSVRDLTDDFAKWAASEKGMKILSDTVKNSAPIFEKVVRITGRLAETLLKAFNNPRVQKAIDGMLDGLGNLFDDFDKFVESEEFTEWIDNSMRVLGKLGDLISATSSMLSDLVTPEAIARTEAFLGNLERFMPHLGNLLDFLGRLDPFGLLAQALADIGDALAPLEEPMGRLADGLNRIIGIAIDEWADGLAGVAEAIAPAMDFLADLVENIPEDVIRGIADALLLFAGALIAVKAVKLTSSILGLNGFFTAIKGGGDKVKKFPLNRLKAIGSGIASFAAIVAVQAIPDDFWDQFDLDSNVTQDMLTGAAFGSMFGVWGVAIGAGIALVTNLFTDFENTMNDVGIDLAAALFSSPATGAFAEFFTGLIPEEWKDGGDNPFETIMGLIKLSVEDTGTFLVMAKDLFTLFFEDITAGWEVMTADVSNEWGRLWNGSINNGALWSAVTDDLTGWLGGLAPLFAGRLAIVRINWTVFWNGLLTTAQNVWSTIHVRVIAFIGGIAARFSTGLGAARTAWTVFWNGLTAPVRNAANTIGGIVNRIMGYVNRALGGVGSLAGAAGSLSGSGGSGSGIPRMASGGILAGPRRILAGEDGPEAIVPLRRSLSRVDPSVRFLSAIAQGLKPPAMGNGGVVGGGRSVVIESGAIVVTGNSDPIRTSVEVLDRVARDL